VKGYNESKALPDARLVGRVSRLEANTIKFANIETRTGTFDGASGTMDITFTSGIDITASDTVIVSNRIVMGAAPGVVTAERLSATEVRLTSSDVTDDGKIEVSVIGQLPV
jgi:hypothetical protein